MFGWTVVGVIVAVGSPNGFGEAVEGGVTTEVSGTLA